MAKNNISSLDAIVKALNIISQREFGENGADYITDTNTHNGDWNALKANGAADVVFNVLTPFEGDALDGMTLKAGDVLLGRYHTIDLTSGNLIAFRKNKE